MEQNMQGVGSILGTLKNMATDMGDEIERQNKHLDLIQGKVGRGEVNKYFCKEINLPFSFFDVMI